MGIDNDHGSILRGWDGGFKDHTKGDGFSTDCHFQMLERQLKNVAVLLLAFSNR